LIYFDFLKIRMVFGRSEDGDSRDGCPTVVADEKIKKGLFDLVGGP
jgi:hypothetical protein